MLNLAAQQVIMQLYARPGCAFSSITNKVLSVCNALKCLVSMPHAESTSSNMTLDASYKLK